jgi:hypothetical protein
LLFDKPFALEESRYFASSEGMNVKFEHGVITHIGVVPGSRAIMFEGVPVFEGG